MQTGLFAPFPLSQLLRISRRNIAWHFVAVDQGFVEIDTILFPQRRIF